MAEKIDRQALLIRDDDCKRTPTGYWDQAPVPVEWYQPVNGGNSHVLVFWIKDQDLGDQPLNNLRKVQRAVKRGFFGLHPIVSLKIIGPRFSGTLQTMVDESEKNEQVEGQTDLEIYSPWSTAPEEFLLDGEKSLKDWFKDRSVTFIRTIQTDDRLVHALIDELKRRGVSVRDECPVGNTCDHIAVIAEWDTLYGRTLPRIFKNAAHDRRVAADGIQPQKASQDSGAMRDSVRGIYHYSYLRGLDGELPQSKSTSALGSSSDEKTSSSPLLKERRQDIERMERPEGRSQLDYVRRLAELLRATENDLRSNCGQRISSCPRFKAIGVLGSDVYDKMLILQALKESFPHVVFFTTDLDARLFHPGELAWTRNLVVASHFDLRLHDDLQGTNPPFRDTYQTATFFTVLRVLDVLKESASEQERSPGGNNTMLRFQPTDIKRVSNFEPTPQVKLHEIGRNGPVDISINSDEDNQTQSRKKAWDKLYMLTPLWVVAVLLISASVFLSGWVVRRHKALAFVSKLATAVGLVLCLVLLLLSGNILINSDGDNEIQSLQQISAKRAAPANPADALMTALGVTACLLVVAVLLIPASVFLSGWVVRRHEALAFVSRHATAVGLVLCLVLLLFSGGSLYLISDLHEGEPFSFLDGVSIWPSQLLRGTVIGLTLLFLRLLYRYSHRTCKDMEAQFSDLLKSLPSPSTPPSSLIDSIKQWWKAPKAQMFIGAWALDEEANAPDKLWREYRKRLHWTWILMRVVPVSVMFFCVGKMILAITGLPFIPFRGQVVEHVNGILLRLAVFGMIVVIFLVLDITQLTSVFIEKLVPKEPIPKTTEERNPPPSLTHLRIIEQLTDRIDDFIYFPAALLLLMVMARSEFIDNWDFPVGLMVVVGLSASYVVASAIHLRQASEVARQRVIDALSAQHRSKLSSDSTNAIRQTIEEVKALSKGAFMPLTQLPVFRAVTFPTGFYALVTLVETFIKN